MKPHIDIAAPDSVVPKAASHSFKRSVLVFSAIFLIDDSRIIQSAVSTGSFSEKLKAHKEQEIKESLDKLDNAPRSLVDKPVSQDTQTPTVIRKAFKYNKYVQGTTIFFGSSVCLQVHCLIFCNFLQAEHGGLLTLNKEKYLRASGFSETPATVFKIRSLVDPNSTGRGMICVIL